MDAARSYAAQVSREVHLLTFGSTRSAGPWRHPEIDNSGWGHTMTDIVDLHVNPRNFHAWWEEWRRSIAEHGNWWIDPERPAYSEGFRHQGQPVVISEVGLWSIAEFPPRGPWETYPAPAVATVEEYIKLYRDVILSLMAAPESAGFSYVQLYDVEGEVNGYLTYDRKPKVPARTIRDIHAAGLRSRAAMRNTRPLVPSGKAGRADLPLYNRGTRRRLAGDGVR